MDEEIKKQLEWINANLNAILKNQAKFYAEIKEIRENVAKAEDDNTKS